MNTPDYSTIKGSAEASFTEKKSEFIGFLRHVETDEEANAYIAEIRAMHRKATHNVYAYILRNGSVTRYSDDGEPQGTAGVPVFEVLRKEGLTDVCCVVTRYFGGILLGGGGLVRAYSHSAKIAIDAAERMIMRSCYPFEITADYNLYGRIANILPEFEVKVLDTAFTDNVTISLLCVSSLADALYDKIVDTANGKIIVHKGEESFGNFA
ncbi:MAG: YigZ family protein [Oscillospiraceae bacterium]|nr:YigZ family protein [Oscillospiraceae bacterium]